MKILSISNRNLLDKLNKEIDYLIPLNDLFGQLLALQLLRNF